MNREEWLTAAALIINAEILAPVCMPAANFRVSCSWPGGGSARKRIGECWPQSRSADGTREIFISPILAQPLAALDVLAHELIHAADDCKSGHKGFFRRTALAIGLTGKMTATVAGPELAARLNAIAARIGEYPHSALSLDGRKKQTTRMLKIYCRACSFVARASQKVVDEWQLGNDRCPCCGENLSFDEGGE